ncbi:MAG: threonine synthase [Anaerolineaceae bacterium]|jgi:threonine synthase
MNIILGLRCSLCNKEYLLNQVTYTCPQDGGNLNMVLDYEAIRQKYEIDDITSSVDFSLWRYLPLLPVSDPGGAGTPIHAAGWTPLFSPPMLAKQLGLQQLWIKDEGRNPTASFKDRASSIVVARGREIKAKVIVAASTGNAGAALAGMAAAIQQPTVIFAPKTAPQAKVAQLLVYGAQVILVDGTYDNAFDLTVEACQAFGWYCRNTGYNPFTAEGKKTAAFEIWENLLLKRATNGRPLCVFIPVGDGNIISGTHKGFKDLYALGWLEQMPRLFGVQSEKSAAIANAYFANTEVITPVSATTIADSISVDLPRDGVRALRAPRETGGTYLTVKDEDIIAAIAEIGLAGIFAEPAGATAYAGLKKAVAQGLIGPEDPVVVLNTGSGLKDVRTAMMSVQAAPIIEPTMAALKKHFNM